MPLMLLLQVVSHGIVGPLATVIQNIARDSIQCRACRLIGNLAQEPCIAELLHNERITASIVAVLVSDSGSSTGTRQMAVRALRFVVHEVIILQLLFLYTLHTNLFYNLIPHLKDISAIRSIALSHQAFIFHLLMYDIYKTMHLLVCFIKILTYLLLYLFMCNKIFVMYF
jgi:hypothetical protein